MQEADVASLVEAPAEHDRRSRKTRPSGGGVSKLHPDPRRVRTFLADDGMTYAARTPQAAAVAAYGVGLDPTWIVTTPSIVAPTAWEVSHLGDAVTYLGDLYEQPEGLQ